MHFGNKTRTVFIAFVLTVLIGGCTAGYIFVNKRAQSDLGLIHGSTEHIVIFGLIIEGVILSWVIYNLVPARFKVFLAAFGYGVLGIPSLVFSIIMLCIIGLNKTSDGAGVTVFLTIYAFIAARMSWDAWIHLRSGLKIRQPHNE